MKNVQISMKKGPFLAIILPWMASYGSEISFLLIFSARDDLVKINENRMSGSAKNNLSLLTLNSWVKGASPFGNLVKELANSKSDIFFGSSD